MYYVQVSLLFYSRKYLDSLKEDYGNFFGSLKEVVYLNLFIYLSIMSIIICPWLWSHLN